MEKGKHQPIVIILIVLLILAAGIIGWLWGNKDDSVNTQPESINSPESTSADIKALIKYDLPDGWREARCEAKPTAVYVIPAGADGLDCDVNPSAPIKISADSGNTRDCNELQNNNNVKKHVCISLYINNHRSLKASTEYLATSSYGNATTINAYYIDIGSNVIRVEYVFHSDNQYEADFDQLANSIK